MPPILALIVVNLGLYWALPPGQLRQPESPPQVFEARYGADRTLREGEVFGGSGWHAAETWPPDLTVAWTATDSPFLDLPALNGEGPYQLLIRIPRAVNSDAYQELWAEVNGHRVELARLADEISFVGPVEESSINSDSPNRVTLHTRPPVRPPDAPQDTRLLGIAVDLVVLSPKPEEDSIMFYSESDNFTKGWSAPLIDPLCQGYRKMTERDCHISIRLPRGRVKCEFGFLIHEIQDPSLTLHYGNVSLPLLRREVGTQIVFEGELEVVDESEVELVLHSAEKWLPISWVKFKRLQAESEGVNR